MSKHGLERRSAVTAVVASLWLVTLPFGGCSGPGSVGGNMDDGGPGGRDVPSVNIDVPVLGYDGSPYVNIDGTICVPLTSCQVGTAQYCGVVGNRCGGSLSCGACP